MSFSFITAISMFKQQPVVNDPILNVGQKITAVIDLLAIALIATFAALAICHINPIPGLTLTHQNAAILLTASGVVLSIDLVTCVIHFVKHKKADDPPQKLTQDVDQTNTESLSSEFPVITDSGQGDPADSPTNEEVNEARAHLEPSVPQPSQQDIQPVAVKEPASSNTDALSPNHEQHVSSTVVSATLQEIKQSFVLFLEELESEIFTFYESHEQKFDRENIHGRMHVGRAVIFCEVMARYLHSKGESVDFSYARRTTGMHDAGRVCNGKDLWEEESSKLLCVHLQSKGMSEEEAHQKSHIVIKKACDAPSLEYKIFQSADCLDIMRICAGNGGRAKFNSKFLTFLRDAPPESDDFKFREALIEEAWGFIQLTEAKKYLTREGNSYTDNFKNSRGFMTHLLKIIEQNPEKFKILSSVL